MKLKLDEVRRLTGPNILWQHPGAIIDVLVDGVDKAVAVHCWNEWSQRLLSAFGWPQEQSIARFFTGGASFAISAPLDSLYSACDLAELIWACCEADLCAKPIPDWQTRLEDIRQAQIEESNPALLELLNDAQAHSVLALCDDDELSLGAGQSVRKWPIRALPNSDDIHWEQFSSIPTALVTGTNGKSTSVRLAAEIAKAAGKTAGVTSTDFVKVGDAIIDHGDYSGPGGARILLRDPRTEIAFLEVARGGILRRGLPLERADAALITNIASDHLGQYGIDTIEELAEAKFVVAKALHKDGVLVVNADNSRVVEQAKLLEYELCWFSLDPSNPLIQQQIDSGKRAVTVIDSTIVAFDQSGAKKIQTLDKIPMTFNGFAQHNVKNALGVTGLCMALRLPVKAIRTGLENFASNPLDNPGRGNLYSLNGVQVIVDFAHNGHGMRAVANMAKAMPARQRIVMFGHAGDRSDNDIADLTRAVVALNADHYILTEYEAYLRGRSLGEIPRLVLAELDQQGINATRTQVVPDPIVGTSLALKLAKPGDIVLLFVLAQREEVHALLTQLASD